MNAATASRTVEDDAVTAAIVRVQQGDADAFARVVEAYHEKLRSSLAMRCPPEIDADEMAQLAFITAYRRIRQFKPGTDFYVWLWVIARMTLLDHIRRSQRAFHNRNKYMDRMILDRTEADLRSGANGSAEHLAALRTCMNKLSESARALLRHRYDDGTPLESVARGLNRTVGALKTQLFQLRLSLRQCVEKQLRREPQPV